MRRRGDNWMIWRQLPSNRVSIPLIFHSHRDNATRPVPYLHSIFFFAPPPKKSFSLLLFRKCNRFISLFRVDKSFFANRIICRFMLSLSTTCVECLNQCFIHNFVVFPGWITRQRTKKTREKMAEVMPFCCGCVCDDFDSMSNGSLLSSIE